MQELLPDSLRIMTLTPQLFIYQHKLILIVLPLRNMPTSSWLNCLSRFMSNKKMAIRCKILGSGQVHLEVSLEAINHLHGSRFITILNYIVNWNNISKREENIQYSFDYLILLSFMKWKTLWKLKINALHLKC